VLFQSWPHKDLRPVFPPMCWQFMLLYFRELGIVHSDPKPLKVQAKISLVVDGRGGGVKEKDRLCALPSSAGGHNTSRPYGKQ
jgi:hypothetical protein